MQLADKVCVVTGSSSGIGRAAALEMASRGAKVVVSDIDDAGGEAVVGEIGEAGGAATYVHADMRSGSDIKDLMDAAVERFGRLDVLHANAGVHETDFTQETRVDLLSEEVWDRVVDVNLKAVWLCAKHAMPHLRASGGGAIVNAASVGGLIGYPMGPAYCSTKAAIMNLTKCMAIDFAPDNVRVNCYCPAAIDTAMTRKYWEAADDKDAIQKALIGSHLIRRIGRPEEVAKLVCFLASDDASFITGSAYVIDGGSLAWRGTIMD
jgi:NAD(P)-dependent dehydrogenase (short-subunit alcohol dehydrogenase family)